MIYSQDGKTVLFIDPAAELLGYTVMKFKDGVATVINAGAIYASSSWELGRRLFYMQKCLKWLLGHFKIDHIISEDFVMPKGRQSGVSVVPSVINLLRMLAYELKLTMETISVPTWHKNLGISSIPTLDKKGQLVLNARGKPKPDWKTPCRWKVAEILSIKLPKTIMTNTSLDQRDLPFDLTDSLGIALAWSIMHHYPKLVALPTLFETENISKTFYTFK